jgi:hypothetical protein
MNVEELSKVLDAEFARKRDGQSRPISHIEWFTAPNK